MHATVFPSNAPETAGSVSALPKRYPSLPARLVGCGEGRWGADRARYRPSASAGGSRVQLSQGSCLLVRQRRKRPRYVIGRLDTQRQLEERIEGSKEYQRLMKRVLLLSERFQRSLDSQQRAEWLKLEDALFEHAWFVQRASFQIGLELGRKRLARQGPRDQARSSRARAGSLGQVERELLSALVSVLNQLRRR